MLRCHSKRRFTSFFLILTLVIQLLSPAILCAAKKERWDERLLTKLANRIESILNKVCAKVSEHPGNDVKMAMFFCDDRHRVFADIVGSVTIKFPKLLDKIRQKFEAAVGSCLSTNGPVSFDFAIKNVEKVGDKAYKISFQADIILTLKEIVRETLMQAASVVGTVTIGTMLSKFVNFCDKVDADALGQAIKDATLTLWALGAGKLGIDAYEMLDRSGKVDIKEMLLKTFTLRTIIYHFGVFMLKSAVAAGATFAKLGLGAAIGSSLAGGVGVFIGAALTVAAVTILGNIVVTKIMVDMPMWWRFRKLRKLYERRKQVEPGSAADNEILDKMDEIEGFCVEHLDDEIKLDRFEILDKLVAKLGKIHKEGGDLAPFEGVIEKIIAKLQITAVHDNNWNAARKYYQLLKAIHRLPNCQPDETQDEEAGANAPLPAAAY